MSKSLVPQIRFKGFTAPWEQRCFSDIAEVRRGLTYTPDHLTNTKINSIRVLRSSNIFDGSFICSDKDDVFVTKNIVRIKTIKNGEILVTAANGSSALVGKHCIVQGVSDGSAVHGGFMLAVKTSFPGFLQASMNSEWYEKFIKIYSSGGNGSIGNLSGSVLLKQEIPIPEEHEIKQIGVFFEKIDSLITLHQRKCDLLKNLKKSLLEKLFPKNNKSTPEIRFKGFTDAWEQRCFSDIAEVRRGLTYTPDHLTNTKINSIRVLRSSNIFDGSFICSDKDDVFVTKNIVRIKTIKNGEILVTAANGSSALVGKHCIVQGVSDGSAVHGGFMLAVKTSFPGFLQASMNSEWYEKFIKIYSSGGNGSIGNLSGSVLLKQEIPIPEEHEIKQIGVFFEKIDSLITLHQRKLEKLKNIKKSLLEKMFV